VHDEYCQSYLEKHCTDESLPPVNGRTAENIARSKGQGDVLGEVSQEFEVIECTHEVKRLIYCTYVDKDILQVKEKIIMKRITFYILQK